MTKEQVLRDCIAWFSKPDRLCKGHFGEFKNGVPVPSTQLTDERVRRLCTTGAIVLFSGYNPNRSSINIELHWSVHDLLRQAIGSSIPLENDRPETTQDDVLDWFKRALKEAESHE